MLAGTGKAMYAVLDCVRTLQPPQTAQSPPQRDDVRVVPQVEAMAMVSNLLNAAGVRGFRLDPPKPDGSRITFSLSDGTLGMFLALRGPGTVSADDHASYLIAQYSDICKGGEFLSGKQSVPSTDGSVVRKVMSTCRSGDNAGVSETTIIRRPDGFLIELTQVIPPSIAGRPEQHVPGQGERAALVNAAIQMRDTR
jgi:hypothetical protein